MKKETMVSVHLLMNDIHGHDTGRCGGVHFGADLDAEWDADPLDWETRGPVCRIAGVALYFSRYRFRIASHREWVGNWCWNAVTMTHNEALRLCRALPALGFTCTGAVEGSPFADEPLSPASNPTPCRRRRRQG